MRERGVVIISTVIFTAVLLWLMSIILRFGERTLFSGRAQLVHLRSLEKQSDELSYLRGNEMGARNLAVSTFGGGLGAVSIIRGFGDPLIPKWEELVNGAQELHCPPGGCAVPELDLNGDLLVHGDLIVSGPLRFTSPSVLTVFGSVEILSIDIMADGVLLSPYEVTVHAITREAGSSAELLVHSSSVIQCPPEAIGAGIILSALERLEISGVEFPSPTGPLPVFAAPYFSTRSHRGTMIGEQSERITKASP